MKSETTLARKPLVLVDMDGVLADLEKGLLDYWRALHPELPFVPKTDRTTHDIRVQYESLGAGLGAQMREIMHRDGFYASLEPLEGAVEAMNAMMALGWEVFICTAAARNTRCIAEKAAWVVQYLGPQWVERLIATRDKTLVMGDVLIDDKPHITGLCAPRFRHILYDQPYNRQTQRERMTWANWREILMPLFPALEL